MQDDYAGHAAVHHVLEGLPTLLATGEHEYTRYGFKQLLDAGVDVLQPDVTWCGGITEARRILAMAAALDLPVIPHGSSVFSCETPARPCRCFASYRSWRWQTTW